MHRHNMISHVVYNELLHLAKQKGKVSNMHVSNKTNHKYCLQFEEKAIKKYI